MERLETVGTTSEIERRTIRKVSWRLLPLIVTIYFVAYMDRTNVSFAAFGMTRDIGLTPYIFGWGAGIFFLGYFIFEVPSNVFLAKTGRASGSHGSCSPGGWSPPRWPSPWDRKAS